MSDERIEALLQQLVIQGEETAKKLASLQRQMGAARADIGILISDMRAKNERITRLEQRTQPKARRANGS